jgi:hypothetical protein
MKSGLFRELLSLVRHLIDLEVSTSAGRVNILGMTFAVLLAGWLSLTSVFDDLVHLFHPHTTITAPILPLFAFFAIFVVTCVLMIGYLEARPGVASSRAGARSMPGRPKAVNSRKISGFRHRPTAAGKPSEREDNAILKAARIGGRYAIAAAIVGALVGAFLTSGFGLFK